MSTNEHTSLCLTFSLGSRFNIEDKLDPDFVVFLSLHLVHYQLQVPLTLSVGECWFPKRFFQYYSSISSFRLFLWVHLREVLSPCSWLSPRSSLLLLTTGICYAGIQEWGEGSIRLLSWFSLVFDRSCVCILGVDLLSNSALFPAVGDFEELRPLMHSCPTPRRSFWFGFVFCPFPPSNSSSL